MAARHRGTASLVLARNVAASAGNRATARLLQREEDGYEFSDDPLSAGGFGPNDATIRVKPGPVRTTLIRPKPDEPKKPDLKLNPNWLERALDRDPLLKALPDPLRKKALDALKDVDETAAEKIIDALPLDDKYKAALQAATKAALQMAKGKKYEPPVDNPYTRRPEWTREQPGLSDTQFKWGFSW